MIVFFQMTIMLASPSSEAKPKATIRKENEIIDDILVLSQNDNYQDVTIICENGRVKSNSFLLTAIFPVFRDILPSLVESDSDLVISIPDMDVSDLEMFFTGLYENQSKIIASPMIQSILSSDFMKAGYISEKEEDKLVLVILDPFIDSQGTDLKPETNIKLNAEADDYSDSAVTMKIEEKDEDTTLGVEFSSYESNPEIKTPKPLVLGIKKKSDDISQYQCQICGRHFDSKKKLGNHKRIHDIKKCKFCQIEISLASLNRHQKNCQRSRLKHELRLSFKAVRVKRKSPRERVSCHICGKSFVDKYVLKNHILKYHSCPEGQIKCEKCFSNVDKEDFSSHICPELPCPKCNRIFNNEKSVSNHIKKHHEYLPDSFYCSDCGKGFPSKGDLYNHMKSHKEKETCPECGAKVRCLSKHMQKHQTEEDKKFICEHCDKRFFNVHLLNKHIMNVHLKLRPYKCRYGCEFAYNDVSNRAAHEKKTHGKLFITAQEEKEKYKESLKKEAGML